MKKFDNFFLEKSIGKIEQIPKKSLPEIVFAGKSNVGKSSLINAIISKRIAYTSKTAGKTILLNFYKEKDFRLVDVPGYGFSVRSKKEKFRFNKLTDDYFKLNRADCVFQLIDFRHDLQDNDSDMINFLSKMEINFHVIFTKIDKIPKVQREQQYLNLKSKIDKISDRYIEILCVSSKTGENINKLRSLIISSIK